MPTGKWRVLVADDEPAARRGVRQLLAPYPEFAIVGECRNGAEVLTALGRLTPDVLFLDVQMPDIDGLDVIRRWPQERMPALVFFTAYEQFAIHAFEAQALDYLVKPVSEARFAATIKRLTRLLDGPRSALTDERIVVPNSYGATVLSPDEIDWIEAADNYVRIWIGRRSFLLRESLGQIEGRLRRHGFVRLHRRALVPLRSVRELVSTSSGSMMAVLSTGSRVPVSRRRRASVAAALRGRPKIV